MRRHILVAGPMLLLLSLAGCNGDTKEQNAALLEENQQLRTQLEQSTMERQAAEDRANRQAEIARAAEQRAEQAAAQASATPITYDAPASAPASNRPAAAASPTVHIVKEGETLSHIALKYYRNAGAWQPIYDANKQAIGPNANRLRVGMRLTIPARG